MAGDSVGHSGYTVHSLQRKMDFSLRRQALRIFLCSGLLPLSLGGCSEGYSPNTYASTAAQEEAAVQRGVIIGVRQVMISATGAVGAVTGGAAGGVAGAEVSSGTVGTALGAIGGTLVGGIGGTAAAQAVADSRGWEYIVQEDGNKLVSVTQTSKMPLPIGQHVLVISDAQQARIVPDYTVQVATAAPKPAAAPGSAAVEMNIGPVPAVAGDTDNLQVAPSAVASDPPAAAPDPTPAVATPASAPASTTSAAVPVSGPAAASVPAVKTSVPAVAATP
jgi:outer membrane lipoprotein SlyB